MLIDPIIVKSAAWLIGVLISIIGFFLARTMNRQDANNKEQTLVNQKLHSSIDTLNTTMATINEGFRWMKEGCAERHSGINNRLKAHSERLDSIEKQ